MSIKSLLRTCASCGSSEYESFDIPYAFLRHMDFEVIKQDGCIFQCSSCQLVWTHLTGEEIESNEALFQDQNYLESPLIEHMVYNSNTDLLESRSFLQAKIIKENVQHENPAVLDIGCFKGDLLRDLLGLYKSADLNGFDINEELRAFFPKKDGVNFLSGDLSDINQQFDIIILSASIMYIKDIAHLMKQIKRLLTLDGVVFINAVDISQNPFAILLGDQFYHYTPTIIKNILSFHGFNFCIFKSDLFPKEFLGFAVNNPDESLHPMERDDTVSWCVKMINDKALTISTLVEKHPNVGVLGTTSAAAFVDSVVQPNVKFFIDENPKRIGLKFHGKNVLDPSELNHDAVVVIPYGESGVKIKERFSRQYNGQFVCV